MKKIIAYLLVMVLAIGFVPTVYAAGETAIFTVNVDKSRVFYSKDDQVEVQIKANATFNAVALTLEYDPELLIYNSFIGSKTKLKFNKRTKYDDEDGKIAFGAASFSNNATYSDEAIFTVIFDVNKDVDVEEIVSEIKIILETERDLWHFVGDNDDPDVFDGRVILNNAQIEFYKNDISAEFM